MTLRIPRILAFAILLLVLQVAIGFAFGGGAALDDAQLLSRYFAELGVGAVVTFGVFALFALGLSRAYYLSAALVVVLAEAVGFVLIRFLGTPPTSSVLWLFEWAVYLAAVVIGTEVGRRLAARRNAATAQ